MSDSLDPDDRAAFLTAHPDWALEGEAIRRSFAFADFAAAMGFVTSIAIAAERADHHPDIDIRWNKVTLTLTTHSAGGLTAKDTSLAAAADGYA